MSRLSKANYIFAIAFLLSVIGTIGEDMRVVERYGWEFEKTTIVGDDITTGTINMKSQYLNYFVGGIMVLFFIKNARNTGWSLTMSSEETEMNGIDFPKGKPEYWFVEADIRGKCVNVGLGDSEVVIPLSKILSWFEEVKEENL